MRSRPTHRAACRSGRRRAGITLVEVLFATGILMLGVLGIMSLVPMAMHQVTITSNKTISAAIAKNALAALQYGQLDLVDYTTTADTALFNTSYRERRTGLNLISSDTALASYAGWPEAIYRIAADTMIGNGQYEDMPSFQIPGERDLIHPATWTDLLGSFTGPRPVFVPAPWARGYGWTATFLPLTEDNDGDGLYDEDPDQGPLHYNIDDDGDGPTDEDPFEIYPETVYRVQIVVWRHGPWRNKPERLYIRHGDGLLGEFQDGKREVLLNGPIPKVDVGDYIRMDDYGVWYRIADIQGGETASPILKLATKFRHPSGAVLTARTVSIANNFKVAGLYEGLVDPTR